MRTSNVQHRTSNIEHRSECLDGWSTAVVMRRALPPDSPRDLTLWDRQQGGRAEEKQLGWTVFVRSGSASASSANATSLHPLKTQFRVEIPLTPLVPNVAAAAFASTSEQNVKTGCKKVACLRPSRTTG